MDQSLWKADIKSLIFIFNPIFFQVENLYIATKLQSSYWNGLNQLMTQTRILLLSKSLGNKSNLHRSGLNTVLVSIPRRCYVNDVMVRPRHRVNEKSRKASELSIVLLRHKTKCTQQYQDKDNNTPQTADKMHLFYFRLKLNLCAVFIAFLTY